ncbi:MAG: hypothetical protein Q9227_002506 [Pyrenula ochraceoflavens]
MLQADDDNAEFKWSKSNSAGFQEWVPTWLRKSRALPIAVSCLIFVVALELFDVVVKRNHGLLADAKHGRAVNAARYLPTLGVVYLGFAWKALSNDVKSITPWSTIRKTWAKTEQSMSLDYITSLEIVSVISALRMGHWAVFFGLCIGFLCGGLAVFSNSLVYINLFAPTSEQAALVKLSQFDFDGTLVQPNGSLPISYNLEASRPFAAVAAERLPNAHFAAFTKDRFAFESFANTQPLKENETIEAEVQAFKVDMNCRKIHYHTTGDPDYPTLEADYNDLASLNCTIPIQQALDLHGEKKIFGYINATSCTPSEDDIDIVINIGVANPKIFDSGKIKYNVTAIGLLCSPKFFMEPARVNVNSSNGEVLSYTLFSSSSTKPVDIKTPSTALAIYLNNPVDGRTQEAYATDDIGFTHNQAPLAIAENVALAADNFMRQYSMDPFTSFLTGTQTNSSLEYYLADPHRFKSDVEHLGNSLLIQVVNFFARKNSSEAIKGEIWTSGERLFIRQPSLRILQTILIVVSVMCVLQMTILRPRTALQESPESIASVAVILASSEPHVENLFAHEAVTTENQMKHNLNSRKWRQGTTTTGAASFEVTTSDKQQARFKPYFTPQCHRHNGYSPIALRIWAKLAIAAFLLILSITLAILLKISETRDGLCLYTRRTLDVLSFVPTVMLVLLGYTVSGVGTAVRAMAPYKSLLSASKKRPLLLGLYGTPALWSFLKLSEARIGFSIMGSSLTILLIPALKIVAASLYGIVLVRKSSNAAVLVDKSLLANLEATYREVDPSFSIGVQSASQFAEWSMIPSFNVPQRSGILDHLVFSNATQANPENEDIDIAGSDLTLNIPAIAVDVDCITVPLDFNASFEAPEYGGPYWTYRPVYVTDVCREKLHLRETTCEGSSEIGMIITSPDLSRLSANSLSSESLKAGHAPTNSNRFQGTTFYSCEKQYQVFLADFSSIQRTITNLQPLNKSGSSFLVRPGIFNVSTPRINAVACTSKLNEVTVNTTFAQLAGSPHSNSTTKAQRLPWSPVRYDPPSIRHTKTYEPSNIPFWIAPLAKHKADDGYDQYDSSTDEPGMMDSNTLRPTRGSSTSIFELLATYGEYKNSNTTTLLDPDTFAATVKAVYVAYTTQILTELRPFASRNLSANTTQVLPGAITYFKQRVKQDKTSTIALEVLFLIISICLVWIFIRFPHQHILPKSPGSIGARASLLAHSRLVDRLRGKGITRVADAPEIWDEQAALGWWKIALSANYLGCDGDDDNNVEDYTEPRTNVMRWGIDVGADVVRSDWNHPPSAAGVQIDDMPSLASRDDGDSLSVMMRPVSQRSASTSESPLLPPVERLPPLRFSPSFDS